MSVLGQGERVTVVTPERVTFEFEVAGFVTRFAAWLIDLLAIALIFALIGSVTKVLGVISPGLQQVAAITGYFLVNWGYFVILEWRLGGQSLGKRAMGLRVISDNGVRLSLYQSAVRNLLRVLDNLPLAYLLGGSVAMWSTRGKRLGDMAAGTFVVRERRLPVPEAIVPKKERYNSFVEDRVVRARVRARLTVDERDVLIRMALRRGELELGRRLQLFAEMAAFLRGRLGVEQPPHFSDEKFCLNVAAVALRGDDG